MLSCNTCEKVFLIFYIIFSTIGNCLIFLVIFKSRRLQSTTNYFILCITFSDLILSTITMPLLLAHILKENGQYTVAINYLQWFSVISINYILVCICFDRYYAIIYPLTFKVTRIIALKMIGSVWSVSLLLTLAVTFWNSRSSIILIRIMFTLLLPISITSFGYCKLFKHVWTISLSMDRPIRRTVKFIARIKVKILKVIWKDVINVIKYIIRTLKPFIERIGRYRTCVTLKCIFTCMLKRTREIERRRVIERV